MILRSRKTSGHKIVSDFIEYYSPGFLETLDDPCLVPRSLFVFRFGESVSDHVVRVKK